ncbi:S46 family peptidase [Mesoterricola sediminis]|uniref:Dipeptidyl-peptidase n=1 Tax=Mesoterricola sediminis TaxID=2927980 RepID=A0AA48GXR3_9BACT|nr:S46 family peptidase [Mesoterricola sediminis]BDU75977.1 dipeptidyl-peptidase [Mesoterricola sediminis]
MRASLTPLLALLIAAPALRADEGMWTFDNLPTQKMKAKYGFAPDAAWLDHVRLSAVRFPGGSGSFISADGLVLTNHHVGHSWIERVSDPTHDYVGNGFVAATRDQEIKVPGLELHTLMSMENVTEALAKAVPAGADEARAAAARQEALAGLLKEARTRTGLLCEPVVLYQGGETWIYAYKVHKDVRLVMAPEYGIAAFGKEWDNFSYPRFCLDFSLFRVYEDGKPYRPAHHLAWAASGPKYGDMTFMVGHPGRTSRLETLAQMEAQRDALTPLMVRTLDRARKVLHAYAASGPEQARQVSDAIMGVENGYKVYVNQLTGLRDKEAMAEVARAEAELRAAVEKDPALKALAGGSWDKVAAATARRVKAAVEESLVGGLGSRTLEFALAVARLEAEAALPKGERDPQFRSDADIERVKGRLKATLIPAPALEKESIVAGLKAAQAELGAAHPFVAAALQGRTPEAAAEALVSGTRLMDAKVREGLLSGGSEAAAKDPMLVLARRILEIQKPIRKEQREVQAILSEHGGRIAQARFRVRGRSVYPDATFTLRLTYGAVETYPSAGTLAPPFTTFGGLYDRADAWGPEAEDHSWELPKRWQEARGRLDLRTRFNFITNNDIIGGNSGSPVVDRQGRLIGLVFDGNIESNAGRFFFDPKVNRAISVDASAILAALDKVYGAGHLVTEINAK